MHPGFVSAEGRIGRAGEAWPEAEEGCCRTRLRIGIVTIASHHHLRARPVVGEEEHDGVLHRAHGGAWLRRFVVASATVSGLP